MLTFGWSYGVDIFQNKRFNLDFSQSRRMVLELYPNSNYCY